ncbi:MAG TPA: thiamine-phosphate kinase [Gammaproteobacteria bacterium]
MSLFFTTEYQPSMPLSEFQLIEKYFARQRIRRGDVALGIGDDAALLRVLPGMELVVAIDAMVEGRHFPAGTDPFAIGHKALAVNLSDMAAMGAEPAWATLAISLPTADEAFVAQFTDGLFSLAHRYGVELVGGDTVRGPLMVVVQMHGLVPAGKALKRSGAFPGDAIYVTGTLGDAGAALQKIMNKEPCSDALRQRLERPEPRVKEGMALREIASSAIDISDGLVADLGHILSASGFGATLEVEALPLSSLLCDVVADPVKRWELALASGDDYELCFTVSPHREATLLNMAQSWPCGVTRIGTIDSTAGLRLQCRDGSPFSLEAHGFDHFAG